MGIYKSLTDTWTWKIGCEAAQFLFGEYINRIFACSVATKKTGKYLEGEPDVVQCEVVRLEAEEDGWPDIEGLFHV